MKKTRVKPEAKDLKPIQLMINGGEMKGLPSNPRFIRTKDYEDCLNSLREDPEMSDVREIVVMPFNENYIIVAGNQRFRAMCELGWEAIPCKILHKKTPMKKVRAFAIKDNVHYGKDDWELIGSDWNITEVEGWNKDVPTPSDEAKTQNKNVRITITDVNEDERDNIKEVLKKAGYTVK